MKKTAELTPLMRQFWDIKSLHQDKILLFRMGDFFEMFYDDAVKAAPILGITLTQRNKKSEDQTPMCGVPHHSIAGPINKLLAAGLKIAICDQIEDPKMAKGLVKRAVTRILTPGMVYDSDTLESTLSHYVVSLDQNSISFIDTTTGESFYFKIEDFEQKLKLIQVLPVAEIVLSSQSLLSQEQVDSLQKNVATISHYELNDKIDSQLPMSAEVLFHYIKSLADENILKVLKPFYEREIEHRLQLSNQTLRHLEIFSTYKGADSGSFYQAINRTQTAAGARLLRQWILFPLRNKSQILERQKVITEFREDLYLLKNIREVLSGMGDIDRRISKIAQPQCQARDLTSLAASLERAVQVFLKSQNHYQAQLDIELTQKLIDEVNNTISEDAPLTLKQGHIIKKGVSPELDEYIELSTNAQSHIEKLEQKEKEETGINSLKIRYNNVFGYYIEITHLHKDKVPARYQRKQTLANAERYCTDELIELERKVLAAQSKRFELEYHLFDLLRNKILSQASLLLKLSAYCSEVDVYTAFAWLSLEESYCLPTLSDDMTLKIKQSRHPVVEQFLRGKFVANSLSLNQGHCYLITGPNMAGKSTLMRQVALTAILCQMGSYVSAEEAQLPLYDAIYTRIGASDQLSEGLSTFMVEMTETADMLKKATPQSLLILDEVGRGTATFDGLCLAQSILEYILENIKSHVFFATHYHELTVLDKKFMQIMNVHMKIFEKNKTIEFLHVLAQGAAGQSYGIQVAEIAGLPQSITERAQLLLSKIEKVEVESINTEIEFSENKKLQSKISSAKKGEASLAREIKPQLSLFDEVVIPQKSEEELKAELKQQALIQEFKNLSVTNISPLQALNKIAEWKEKYLN